MTRVGVGLPTNRIVAQTPAGKPAPTLTIS